ncbi:hypothetical protein ABE425_14695 [Chryseobacterium cucumeris]|uniref:hypothetical protein n=1 Tax=Chryseobacterium cucumeris TaxID=1813611 RepID=UPI003209D7AB
MDKEIVRMAIYENIVTIIAIVIIWLCTDSAWSLLLLINMNNVKARYKTYEEAKKALEDIKKYPKVVFGTVSLEDLKELQN